jgi:hypothetical protein
LTNRISALHRRLIDPASDLETMKAAKQGLLRLLFDPLTLPVITTRPMEMPLGRRADIARKFTQVRRRCEICDRPLPTQITGEQPKSAQSCDANWTLRVVFPKPPSNGGARHSLSVRALGRVPRSSRQSLS